ncbi:kinase domain protein (macronuclear) [Tetrahymena thermophila SB210]|uniref:Kinase domain protein n=1 Tax=Tetrahymena thermophila (strain SB210) TaxID=312017 RepID=Q22P78_TETTS|nr:kinase domain protein [Tetrahymena thermophila SB210]EAR87231.2 kinase domain protein [Tetrahymena thermophila SB210]|eukprot:XP_001007476.2 kinase domain protein [Tetrahymena thermophila SB210]
MFKIYLFLFSIFQILKEYLYCIYFAANNFLSSFISYNQLNTLVCIGSFKIKKESRNKQVLINMYQDQRQELLNCKQQFQILQNQSIHDFLKRYGYVYEKQISRSSSSLVVQAKSLNHNNSNVAIKILNYKYNSKINSQKLSKQVDFLDNLKGEKYVLQFIERIQDLNQGITAIVTEYCEKNLAQILEINKLAIEQVYALAYQLLKGLLLIQEKQKVLRYIEPEKILYSAQNNQFLLSYLSFSRLIQFEGNEKQQGNLNYQSPEVINKKKPYKITADIFSIGVILLEALLQRKLKGMEYLKLKSQSLISVLPDLLNEQNHQFVTKILSKMVDPDYCKRSEPIYLLQILNELKADQKYLKPIKLEKNIENKDVQLQTANQLGNEENPQSISVQKLQIEQIKKATIEKEKIVQVQINEEEDIIEIQIGQYSVQEEFNDIQNQNTNMKNGENHLIQPNIEIIQNDQNINQIENLRQNVHEENTENISNEQKQNEQNKEQIEEVQKYIEIEDEENFQETQIGQQNMNVKYIETPNQITNMQNGEYQNIKPLKNIIQSSPNISATENIQIENQIQQDIGRNFNNEQIILTQSIDHSQSDFEEPNQSLMEIEMDDQQEINLENQTNLHLEQQIKNRDLNFTHIKNNKCQDKFEEEIIVEKLKEKNNQNNNNITKKNEVILDKEVQNNLNKLIKYIKCKYFNRKSYKKNRQRVLKIVDLKQIPQVDEDYEIIEIELINQLPSEDQILKIGKILQKCINIESISLNISDSFRNKEKYLQQLIQCLDNCDNLSFLSLNVFIDIEGEQQLGEWIGQCRNLHFLNLNLNFSSLFNFNPQAQNVGSNIVQGLSQSINLVHLDLNLSYYQFKEKELSDFGKAFARNKNLNFLSFDMSYSKGIQGFDLFLEQLQECKNLISLNLNLSNCDINSQNFKLILYSIQYLENLKFLDLNLDTNDLKNLNLQQEIEFYKYKSLTNLKLDLQNCKMSKKQINLMLSSFEMNENLNCLHLILRQIQNQQKILKKMYLISENSLTQYIPEDKMCFYRIKNLTNLSLQIQQKIVFLIYFFRSQLRNSWRMQLINFKNQEIFFYLRQYYN